MHLNQRARAACGREPQSSDHESENTEALYGAVRPGIAGPRQQCGRCSVHDTGPSKSGILGTDKGRGLQGVLSTHLQQIPPLMNLLDVFVCEDAARSLELAGALPGASGDNRFMHAVRRGKHTKPWHGPTRGQHREAVSTEDTRETMYQSFQFRV